MGNALGAIGLFCLLVLAVCAAVYVWENWLKRWFDGE